MRIETDGAQDLGTRHTQQDAYDWASTNKSPGGLMAVLSDGIGGGEDGDYYSQLAVETMLNYFCDADPGSYDNISDFLLDAYQAARKQALNNPKGEGGATVVAVLLQKNKCSFLSSGDSKIYLLRGGGLILLNRMQTLGTELDVSAALGYLMEAEAKGNRMRAALYNHLCEESDKPCDRCLEPFALQNGDKIALMSDGVSSVLSEEELYQCMQLPDVEGAKEAIRRIKKKNLEKQDNCSIMILSIDEIKKRKKEAKHERTGHKSGYRASRRDHKYHDKHARNT